MNIQFESLYWLIFTPQFIGYLGETITPPQPQMQNYRIKFDRTS